MSARVQCGIRWLLPLTLMPAGALAVHQLRYWLAFGHLASAAIQRQGHAYLHSLLPWVVLLVALALGVFVRALGRAFSGHCSPRRYAISFVALWLVCTAALIVIYAGQELLEGVWANGHPAGVAGIFGFGGWWSVPAATAIGLVLAATFHGARWVLSEVVRRVVRRRTGLRPAHQVPRFVPLVVLRPALLAGGWSGRGPPRSR